jgi:hypothetical protein
MKPLLNDKEKPFTKVQEYGGYLFSDKPGGQLNMKIPDFLADLNELTFDDDDVCIVSYPKSGMIGTK